MRAWKALKFFRAKSSLPRNRSIASVVALLAILVLFLPSLAARPASAPRATSMSLKLAWQQSLSPNADAVPAYAPKVAMPDGHHTAVVYALAGNNQDNCQTSNPVRTSRLYAFVAGTGTHLWTQTTSGPSRCTTAGPTVDATGTWVYAAGLDGRIHRYAAGSGTEYRGQGWPILVSKSPDVEKFSSRPTIGTGHLYVTISGYTGDQGHYEGHMVTITLRTGHTGVFNTVCSNVHHILSKSDCSFVESALFGRGEGEVDPVTHDVWIVTGNGPWNGTTNWGDSVLRMSPSGTTLLDSFTPPIQQALADQDQDLGSTAPALLPTIHQAGQSYHLLVQGGKGPACNSCRGVALWLLNRDNLSGQAGPGHIGGALQTAQAPGGCEVLTAPAVWHVNRQIWVFYANGCGTAGYRLSSPSPGTFRLHQVWSDGTGGSTPVMHGEKLFVAHDGAIVVRDPRTGYVLTQAALGGVHWEYPVVAEGRVFISDEDGHLSAYQIQG